MRSNELYDQDDKVLLSGGAPHEVGTSYRAADKPPAGEGPWTLLLGVAVIIALAAFAVLMFCVGQVGL